MERAGRMGEVFGGELSLQTEIVTDSHRTICGNDMFQRVSLQYAELFASGLLICTTPFICSDLLAYLSEITQSEITSTM